MGQREHLGRLRVGTVDEDQGGEHIGEYETAKLLGIQPAMGVASHDAASHHQDADVFRAFDELAQRLALGSQPPTLLNVEAEGIPQSGSGKRDVGRSVQASHELERQFP